MVAKPVVEVCEHCRVGFTDWWQIPPCGKECSYHQAFRIRETQIAESIRRLGKTPKHEKCGNHLTAIDMRATSGAHLTWECKPCRLLFAVGEIKHDC